MTEVHTTQLGKAGCVCVCHICGEQGLKSVGLTRSLGAFRDWANVGGSGFSNFRGQSMPAESEEKGTQKDQELGWVTCAFHAAHTRIPCFVDQCIVLTRMMELV